MKIWKSIRGFVAGTVAFLACPCHLPITLPIFLTLTAGTAVGGWFATNTPFIYTASAVLFAGGLFLAGKWLLAEKMEAGSVDLPVDLI